MYRGLDLGTSGLRGLLVVGSGTVSAFWMQTRATVPGLPAEGAATIPPPAYLTGGCDVACARNRRLYPALKGALAP